MSDDGEQIKDEILERKLADIRKEIMDSALSRERSCAITKIDEAMHWLAAGRDSRAQLRLDVIRGIANGHDDRHL